MVTHIERLTGQILNKLVISGIDFIKVHSSSHGSFYIDFTYHVTGYIIRIADHNLIQKNSSYEYIILNNADVKFFYKEFCKTLKNILNN